MLSEGIHSAAVEKQKSSKEFEFLLAFLRAELLHDLLLSLDPSLKDQKNEKKKSKSAHFKFYLLALAGTILAACEGFDSISTLLGVFSLPSIVTLIAGLAFAGLSVMVFYGFNLVQVANNLDVKLVEAPKLLDLYLQQFNEIKSLRKQINTYKLAKCSLEELKDFELLLGMLEYRLLALNASCKQFKEAVNSPKINFAKNLFGGVAGLLFFGSGFFAGQSVGAFLLGLVMVSATPTFLPVVLFSVLVGLAAFSLYWYVEKVGLQQLISGWFGLDEEKIEKLCGQGELEKQAEKLNNLKEKIIDTAELKNENQKFKASYKEKKPDEIKVVDSKKQVSLSSNTSQSGNIYTFHQPAKAEPISPSISPIASLSL